jgi:phosphoglycerol transferase MdoB-like AlkP superfamily enzyme
MHYGSPVLKSQSGNRPNILLIALESIRSSATSPYNSAPKIRNLTPNLYQLSQSGILVEHAYSTVPHTSKALVGILCGQFPRLGIDIVEANPGGLPVTCLPKLLSQVGYHTAFFQSALGEFENRHGLTTNMGFHETYTQEQLPNQSYKKLSYVGMDDYIMLKPSIDWMKRQVKHGHPFFISMLTVVSHHPYLTPEAERNHYHELAFVNEAFSAYLASVSYTDRFIGHLIREMQQAGLMENTIVIITGDHGEAFAEHGPVFHNGTPHEEGMKVPLILYSPDLLPAQKRIDGLRSHLDLLPTILELSGIEASRNIPGKSLWNSSGHESLAITCWYDDHCAALYKDSGEKYIY